MLFAIASVPAPAVADETPRVVLRLDRSDQFPYPYALEELAARAMDCAGTSFEPVEILDNSLARLRSMIAPRQSTMSVRAQKLIASDGRKLGFDAIVFMQTRLQPEGFVITLFGAGTPFKESFAFESVTATITNLATRLPVLVDSLIAILDLPRGVADWSSRTQTDDHFGMYISQRTIPHATWESEDLYAEGAQYGDYEMIEQALAVDSSNAAAQSLLGFRLTLGDAPARGWELLTAVKETRLSPYDRAVHKARLALATPGASDASATDALRRGYPSRFESELLYAIPFARLGDIQGADRAIRNAIRLRPHDPLPHRVLAEAGLRAGMPDVAAQEFAAADRLAEGDWIAIIGIASTKYSQGFVPEAFDILSNVMPPRFHSWSVYYKYLLARANLSLAGGEPGAAIAAFSAARDRAYRAGNREAVLDLTARLVWANLEAERIEQAAYEAADLRFEQDSTYFYRANPGIAPFLEGVVAAAAGDLGAVTARRLELESDPRAPDHLALLIEGLYYVKGGSAWEGIPALRRAYESHPDSYARFLLGLAYFESGDASRAWQILEENVERGESLLDSPPTLPFSFYYLGRALESRGDTRLASIAFGEFLNYRKQTTAESSQVRYARERVSGK